MVRKLRWFRSVRPLLLAAALAAAGTPAAGQDLTSRLGLGAHFGGVKFFANNDSADVADSKIGPYYGGKVAYGLSPRLLLTAGVSRGLADADYGGATVPDSLEMKAIVLAWEIGLDWRILGRSRVTPYVGAGAGVTTWRHLQGKSELDGDSDFSWRVGGGLQIGLSRRLLLDVGARYHGLSKAGEDLYDGGDRSKNYAEATAALFLFTNPLHCRDSDEDGVCDVDDKCPDTPRGCIVDERGCPRDSDGDGVCDGLDQCPETAVGCIVDAQGCPKDSDADGVCDGLDQCPDTPKGCLVDEKGCPRDADGDGVCDGLDQCPDTPAGTPVDERGCPRGGEVEAPPPSGEYLETVHFDFDRPKPGSTDVAQDERILADMPSNTRALRKNLADLEAHPDWRVLVEGHADWIGTDEYNDALSGRRAWAARTWLVDHGIAAARIDTVHLGETRPVADNTTDEGRARNRRAEFRVRKP